MSFVMSGHVAKLKNPRQSTTAPLNQRREDSSARRFSVLLATGNVHVESTKKSNTKGSFAIVAALKLLFLKFDVREWLTSTWPFLWFIFGSLRQCLPVLVISSACLLLISNGCSPMKFS